VTLTLGDGLTPFFIDHCTHPSLQLLAPTIKGSKPQGLYSRRMRDLPVELTVRELLSVVQQERTAKLDAGRVDTVFQVGDQVLLQTKELLDTEDISKLQPLWDGQFTVMACPSPNAYTLALPLLMLCSPTVNVVWL
jgi:hypothetical protein